MKQQVKVSHWDVFFLNLSHSALPQVLPHFHVRLVQSPQPRIISKKSYTTLVVNHSPLDFLVTIVWPCYTLILLAGTRWQHFVDNSLQTLPSQYWMALPGLIKRKMPVSPWPHSIIYFGVGSVESCCVVKLLFIYLKS